MCVFCMLNDVNVFSVFQVCEYFIFHLSCLSAGSAGDVDGGQVLGHGGHASSSEQDSAVVFLCAEGQSDFRAHVKRHGLQLHVPGSRKAHRVKILKERKMIKT